MAFGYNHPLDLGMLCHLKQVIHTGTLSSIALFVLLLSCRFQSQARPGSPLFLLQNQDLLPCCLSGMK